VFSLCSIVFNKMSKLRVYNFANKPIANKES
jgi:hypothetical protein